MARTIYETLASRKEPRGGSTPDPPPDTRRLVRARGRPRSTAADAAILSATLELLPEQGFRSFSMEAVAAKACVSKATLYRRFPSKHELVAAALRTIRSVSAAPDTGSVRGDLRELVRREVAHAKRVPHLGRLAARLLGDLADEPDMLALVHKTVMAIDRVRLAEIVRRGIARGELRADLEVALATEILHASLIFRFLASGGRLSTLGGTHLTPLIDTLLAGLARRG
jgi:AcrR family transcriptional regulator